MKAQEIRRQFLEFFAQRDHAVRPSDGLIPTSDPTLLFTSAGMVPFKPLWTDAPLEFKRAASVQKCLRVGGKDSDLENVGRTLRHNSFFEMLGNFSFGDYFKKEAIEWAWEFIIEVMRLDRESLWVSVFKDDDEAFEFWNKGIGIPAKKIVRLGSKDNFWGPAGTSGPCGPCSEIYFDRGSEWGCGRKSCSPGCDCERYFEFWNLVFPQFYQEPSGERIPLARRGIDTGMGLERLALLAQGADTNYGTDLFVPIIECLETMASLPYGPETITPYHVIADHIRALTFTISENILPSNEGRGYVVRRLLRRAVRFGRKIGLEKPFLYGLAASVVKVMSEPYPELLESREHVSRIIKAEEERFGDTLTMGLEKLDEIAETLKKSESVVPGREVFKLYDTYGFPPELTEEVVREKGLSIDWPAFEVEMEKQRERGRKAWKGKAESEILPIYRQLRKKLPPADFLGYGKLALRAKVSALLKDGREVASAGEGEKIEVLLSRTPFYPEGGGQVGDSGVIDFPEGRMEVNKTFSPLEGLIIHRGKLAAGKLEAGAEVEALVDQGKRKRSQGHHTATHLLQFALREVLGEHISQAGSYVDPDYFRFDFTHFEALKKEELARVEGRVNELVLEDSEVKIFYLPLAEAKKQGALAFFGEKYAETVRMIDIGGYSRELCGGTHVGRTGEIGLFVIAGESSIASGVRRIEAVCGMEAYRKLAGERSILAEAARGLKTTPDQFLNRLKHLEEKLKQLENEKSALLQKQAFGDLDAIIEDAPVISGVRIVAANLGAVDINSLRQVADSLKQKMEAGIAVLGSISRNKVSLVAVVTADLVKEGHHAGEIVKMAARHVRGSGGGRADLAQAGGTDPKGLKKALDAVPGIVEELGRLKKGQQW